MDKLDKILDDLITDKDVDVKDLTYLLENKNEDLTLKVYKLANYIKNKFYKNFVYLRGLIEITNVCQNNCYYCGIRKDNKNLKRYILTEEEVLNCCELGANLGIKTFVLQGGETDLFDYISNLIKKIKSKYQDFAITLSLGEQPFDYYKAFKNLGADRYLLRHETISKKHYSLLHPKEMSIKNRKKCLYELKRLNYQVGSGFMVGSPYQNYKNIAKDIVFLKKLNPHMIGIGPFIPHNDTPFKKFEHGSIDDTLFLIALLRIIFKKALIPATTSLETLDKNARIKGLKVGANVIMPNISPPCHKKDYSLYNNKPFEDDIENSVKNLIDDIEKNGYIVKSSKGDSLV